MAFISARNTPQQQSGLGKSNFTYEVIYTLRKFNRYGSDDILKDFVHYYLSSVLLSTIVVLDELVHGCT